MVEIAKPNFNKPLSNPLEGRHHPPGIPKGAATSFFEFWPTWLMYAPVALLWLLLAIRHRSLTLPLLANPHLPLAGMVGVSKHQLMSQARGRCRAAILPWIRLVVGTDSAEAQTGRCLQQVEAAGIELPFVCKPDIGCRGAGIKLIRSRQQLEAAIAHYPAGSALLCQKLANWEPEAGIFYVRDPESGKGEIASMAFKYTPSVIGDGIHTLQQLVAMDERAGQLQHLYLSRNRDQWHQVIPEGKRHRLLFSASHCRGAVFRDARAHITPELTHALCAIMDDLPQFHYGRLDVKFSSVEALREGHDMEIVEINSASSESIHIWDRDTTLLQAMRALLWQYRTLFRLGAWQRRRGLTPPGLLALLCHWRLERRLSRHYPETD